MTDKLVKITGKKALKGLRKAVKEKGKNYVDPNVNLAGCMYFDSEENPCCVVGHVLSYNDAKIDPHSAANQTAISAFITDVYGFYFTTKAEAILEAAQTVQDEGKTWGQALKAAEEAAAYYEKCR